MRLSGLVNETEALVCLASRATNTCGSCRHTWYLTDYTSFWRQSVALRRHPGACSLATDTATKSQLVRDLQRSVSVPKGAAICKAMAERTWGSNISCSLATATWMRSWFKRAGPMARALACSLQSRQLLCSAALLSKETQAIYEARWSVANR